MQRRIGILERVPGRGGDRLRLDKRDVDAEVRRLVGECRGRRIQGELACGIGADAGDRDASEHRGR